MGLVSCSYLTSFIINMEFYVTLLFWYMKVIILLWLGYGGFDSMRGFLTKKKLANKQTKRSVISLIFCIIQATYVAYQWEVSLAFSLEE